MSKLSLMDLEHQEVSLDLEKSNTTAVLYFSPERGRIPQIPTEFHFHWQSTKGGRAFVDGFDSASENHFFRHEWPFLSILTPYCVGWVESEGEEFEAFWFKPELRREVRVPVFRDTHNLSVIPTPVIRVRVSHSASVADLERWESDYGLYLIAPPEAEGGSSRKEWAEAKRDFLFLCTKEATGEDPHETWFQLARQMMDESDKIRLAAPDFLVECKRDRWDGTIEPKQWHLDNTGSAGGLSGEDLQIRRAWDLSRGSASVRVAVLDDGVDLTHPGLRNRIAPDSGYDFIEDNDDASPKTFRYPFHRVEGNDIHGTPCAGLVAANGHDDVWGVAPECHIVPIRIFDADRFVSTTALNDAFLHAAEYAHIVSCSWHHGLSADPLIKDTLRELAEERRDGKGIPIFCAAGNDGNTRIPPPANSPHTIAVGASTNLGNRAGFSNYSPGSAWAEEDLALVAPSSGGTLKIMTCDVSQPDRGFSPGSLFTDQFGGTSAATPLAAGVAALMLSLDPSLSRQDIIDILKDTADRIDPQFGNYDANGWSRFFGYGRINAYRALQQVQLRNAQQQLSALDQPGAPSTPSPSVPEENPKADEATDAAESPTEETGAIENSTSQTQGSKDV